MYIFILSLQFILGGFAFGPDQKKVESECYVFREDTAKPFIHYSLPDSTKAFVKELLHPETRDSIYYSQKDVVDIFIGHVLKKPIKKRKHKLYFTVFPSTDVRTGNALVTATNMAFYMGKSKETKLSSFTFVPVYTLHDQFVVPVKSNVWTERNRLNFIGDWRFMKYPQYSYDLGSKTQDNDQNLINYKYVRVYQDVLKQIGKATFVGLGYRLDYHYNIASKPNTQYIKEHVGIMPYPTGTTGTSISSGVTFNLLYDNRPNSINPDVGWYANAILRLNMKALGSYNNTQSLYLDVRKYFRFSQKFDDILAIWGLAWFAFTDKTPYLDLPSLGWDTYSATGRGYTQGRFRGINMLYLEAEYRFGLMSNGLVGGVVFANMSSYTGLNTSFEGVVPALGTGLRIKLNKSSDTNFTFDYAHGLNSNWGLWIAIGEYF